MFDFQVADSDLKLEDTLKEIRVKAEWLPEDASVMQIRNAIGLNCSTQMEKEVLF